MTLECTNLHIVQHASFLLCSKCCYVSVCCCTVQLWQTGRRTAPTLKLNKSITQTATERYATLKPSTTVWAVHDTWGQMQQCNFAKTETVRLDLLCAYSSAYPKKSWFVLKVWLVNKTTNVELVCKLFYCNYWLLYIVKMW